MAESVLFERNHYLIQPVDLAQRTVTEKVEQAARNKIISDYKIRLNPGYMTTITCVYVESMIRTLVQLMRENKGEASLNFLDLMTISSTNRENEDADKDGNINIKFRPGPSIETIMERDYCPVMLEEMWKDDIIIEHVEKECANILAHKHKITGNNRANWTKVAYVYLEYLFRTLKLMAKVAKENGQAAVSVNFLEMFEAHCTYEAIAHPDNPDLIHENLVVKIRPGFQAKLLIKDDGVTEIDDED